MEGAMINIAESVNDRVPIPDDEYLGDDGLLHCKVCHKQTQTVVEIFGVRKKVRCICDCIKKDMEEREKRERQQEFDRMRMVCFGEALRVMVDWTFDNDDRRDAKIADAMRRYADGFAKFREESKGLLLYGDVGTGKTYYAACIANQLISNGYTVLMTNFATLTNKIQGTFDGKQELIDSLNRYSLLIIDDLGTERNTDYMKELVFNIIDARYRSGLPMILTTNLPMDEIKKSNDIGYTRIYDRILERCFPVAVKGHSRRRQHVRDSYVNMKDEMGL